MKEWLIEFIATFMPGFWILVGIFVGHIVMSTVTHIVKKDFKISEWPNFFKMWILFMIGILGVNSTLVVSDSLADPTTLKGVMAGVQALVYGGYFSYYLDNLFKNIHRLNPFFPDGAIEAVKAIIDKLKLSIIGDKGDDNI